MERSGKTIKSKIQGECHPDIFSQWFFVARSLKSLKTFRVYGDFSSNYLPVTNGRKIRIVWNIFEKNSSYIRQIDIEKICEIITLHFICNCYHCLFCWNLEMSLSVSLNLIEIAFIGFIGRVNLVFGWPDRFSNWNWDLITLLGWLSTCLRMWKKSNDRWAVYKKIVVKKRGSV